MKMKKWLSGMMVLVMLVTMLAGCGNQADPSENPVSGYKRWYN